MIQSEHIEELMASLVKFQSELPTMPKDASGYGYKYTDLDTIVKTIKPIMAKYNIAFMQSVGGVNEEKLTITTRIFSAGGQYIEDTVLLPEIQNAKLNKAQVLGATITYMRRYTLCALLGITADEDVDCAVPIASPAPKVAPKQHTEFDFEPKGGPTTPEEGARIKALLSEVYANGQSVFSVDEKKTYSGYRKDKTAKELIEFIENALRNRRPDSALLVNN